MALPQIARIMHDHLYRGVERDYADLLQFDQKEEFFVVKSKPYAINLLAFSLGHIKQDLVDMDQFERSDLLTDRKLHGSLAALVDRMPTLEFQLIPLVLLRNDRLEALFLLRVRTAAKSAECVYLDLANRKYERFEEFLTNNKFPTCTMWYPKDGLLRYTRSTPNNGLMLVIDSCKITNTTSKWLGIAIAGSVIASLISFTPLSVPLSVPLIFATASTGFSFFDLCDSYKHEKGTVVARRAVALAMNLTTFASAGLTAVCRMEKLRKMVPADKLLQLERAERLLNGTMRGVATGSVIHAVIGTVGGWQTLSNAEWVELAVILCFAYREQFNQENAIRLFNMMQRDGVFKFFQNLCPNVASDILRSKLGGPAFEKFLQMTMDYLTDNVNFKVDDNFVNIYLFGYELQFDLLFQLDWQNLKMLLLFLQESASTVINLRVRAGWTQLDVNDVIRLLQTVSRIPNYVCKLDQYITLGRGHRFSVPTVRALLAAKQLDRICLLKELAVLTPEQTKMLNALRESGRISGGDQELFNWLGKHSPFSYHNALVALIMVADVQEKIWPKQSNTIQFIDNQFSVNSILRFNASDFLNLSESSRTILLGDERFLRLCFNADEQFLDRANKTWMRTCYSNGAINSLETIGLLEQLFQRISTTSAGSPTLASALDYALDFKDTTVPKVYYSIVSAWNQFTVPLDKRTLQAGFLLLMNDAQTLGMARYQYPSSLDNDDLAVNDAKLIKVSRKALLNLADYEKTQCSIPFGPPERAAFWLGMLPKLRNETSRKRFIRMLITLVTNGTGSVLKSQDSTLQYNRSAEVRMVMFVKEKHKVLVELVIPTTADSRLRVSLYMCGSTICAASAEW